MLLRRGAARGEERSLELAGLHVTEWSRKLDDVSGKPVLVFSHGFHAARRQSRLLDGGARVADFLVPHRPSRRDLYGGAARWIDRPATPSVTPKPGTMPTYRDRGDDVRR